MHFESEELLCRLQLIRSENIGPQKFAALLGRFGSAKAALEALRKGAAPFLHKMSGKPIRLANRDNAERELAYAQKIGAHFIALDEADYPVYMKEIDNPPPLIAVKGNISLLKNPSFAIVGSRNASAIGQRLSSRFAHALGEAGFVICSGFARGIDTHAHKAALQGGTIAVTAGGVDHIYPPENNRLYQEILAQGGAFISEMPLGWQPRAADFPRRNRLIAALSLGLLVVEASERSGSLITARYAAEAGRIVFAIPGSPLDPRAKGANMLIKNGACLADCPEDITEILSPLTGSPARDTATLFTAPHITPPIPAFAVLDDETAIIRGAKANPAAAEEDDLTVEEKQRLQQSLSLAPIAIDSLAQATQIPLSRLYLGLMELELAGRLIRHNGGMVSALPD